MIVLFGLGSFQIRKKSGNGKSLSNPNTTFNFTIEFNPNKSLNCQAKSAAMLITLYRNNLLERALQSIESFKEIVMQNKKEKFIKEETYQRSFF